MTAGVPGGAVPISAAVRLSVYPLADGGAEVRWDAADGALDIEIDADGDVCVMVTVGTWPRSTHKSGTLADMRADVAAWITAHGEATTR